MMPSPNSRQALFSSWARSASKPAIYLSESALRVTDLNWRHMGEIFSHEAKEEMMPHCSSSERSRKLMGSISKILT